MTFEEGAVAYDHRDAAGFIKLTRCGCGRWRSGSRNSAADRRHVHDDRKHPALRDWLRAFRPAPPSVSAIEQLRSATGALIGILLTGLVSTWVIGANLALPFIIAPMGASAVLLFAVPSSPLAQPWSIVGGNTIAALVGVSAAHLVHQPIFAAAAAIGISIAIMFPMRCIHPPGGAVALTSVLGGPAVEKLGYGFVLAPVLLNSVLLMLVALAFNNATRRTYPHAQIARDTGTTAGHGTRPTRLLSFSRAISMSSWRATIR